MLNTTGERIQNLRTIHNMSQAELGKELCVSRDVIAKWEGNEREIKASNLISIANYFNVSVDYLLCRTDVVKLNLEMQKISELTGLSGESVYILMHAQGYGQEGQEKSDDCEEMLELLNLLIPSLEYSFLLKEFYNVLTIYRNMAEFRSQSYKGSWVEIGKEIPCTITLFNNDGLNFLLYEIANEFKDILRTNLDRKYRKGGDEDNASQDNP